MGAPALSSRARRDEVVFMHFASCCGVRPAETHATMTPPASSNFGASALDADWLLEWCYGSSGRSILGPINITGMPVLISPL